MKKIIILISILAISFISCTKSGTQNEFLLTEKMKSQNPFMGGEKLYFMTDHAEQIVFNVMPRNNQFHKLYLDHRTDIWDQYEFEQTSINSEKNGEFSLEMDSYSGYTYSINYRFEKQGNSFTFDLPITKQNTNYIDSLKIMEQWYYDIFIYEGDTTNPFILYGDTIENYAYKLYYSTQYGIVKLGFLDDSYLELERIEW